MRRPSSLKQSLWTLSIRDSFQSIETWKLCCRELLWEGVGWASLILSLCLTGKVDAKKRNNSKITQKESEPRSMRQSIESFSVSNPEPKLPDLAV
jgi:hypothetical protein